MVLHSPMPQNLQTHEDVFSRLRPKDSRMGSINEPWCQRTQRHCEVWGSCLRPQLPPYLLPDTYP